MLFLDVKNVFSEFVKYMKPIERNDINGIEHHQLEEQNKQNDSCC